MQDKLGHVGCWVTQATNTQVYPSLENEISHVHTYIEKNKSNIILFLVPIPKMDIIILTHICAANKKRDRRKVQNIQVKKNSVCRFFNGMVFGSGIIKWQHMYAK